MGSARPVLKYPVIVGPTAGGKTALSIALCREYERRGLPAGHAVAADAYQIYTGMDIGTAKPTAEERAQAEHHLIDMVDPNERFTVADWLEHADAVTDRLISDGIHPVIVGGTNLYIQTFLDGMFSAPEPSDEVMAQVQGMEQSERRAKLLEVDPEAHERIDSNDLRRTRRALAVFLQTGTPITELQRQWDQEDHARSGAVLVGLHWPSEEINPRINARVKQMIEMGLVEEARSLWESGKLGEQASQAIGYKQLIEHFEGRCSLDDAIERIKIDTRRFAKNQRTWLKRFRGRRVGSIWIDAPGRDADTMSRDIVDRLLEAE
ncbi:MAG: tRNA (adenosine(37)-N6)-dimethylallyltransferase MiaA [Phycisphaerales bacterium]